MANLRVISSRATNWRIQHLIRLVSGMSGPGPSISGGKNTSKLTKVPFTDDEKENILPGLTIESLPENPSQASKSETGIAESLNETFVRLIASSSDAQLIAPTNLATSELNVEPINSEIEHSTSLDLCAQIHYQVRRPVESWKYNEAATSDGQITYTCTLCNSAYKHKKSLNKHWKDKHPEETGPSHSNFPTSSKVTLSVDRIPQPRLSVPLQRSKGTLKPFLNFATPTMVKRRRTETPISEVQLSPLDLSKSGRQEAESSPTVSEEDPCSRRSLTETLMSSLFQLEAEPPEVKTIDAVSQNTIDALRLLRDQLESVLAVYSDRRRSGEIRIHCPICPFVGKWYSELKNHVANHSAHKLFGCGSCLYRSKWRWDVVKHMKKCQGNRSLAFLSNPELMRFIKFFPPPPMDILYGFYNNDTSSSSIGPNQPLDSAQQQFENPDRSILSRTLAEPDLKISPMITPSDALVKEYICFASMNQRLSYVNENSSESPSTNRGQSELKPVSPTIPEISRSSAQVADNPPFQLSIALPMQSCSPQSVKDSNRISIGIDSSTVAIPGNLIVRDPARMTIRSSLRLPLPPLRQIQSARTKLEANRTPLVEENSKFRPPTGRSLQEEDEDKENEKINQFPADRKKMETLDQLSGNNLLKSS